jgi:DedD protein
MEPVNVRNLDDIQEDDRSVGSSRFAALLLASLTGAAIVTALVVMSRPKEPAATSRADPLAALVAEAKDAHAAPDKLDTKDVSFPGLLSDGERPTTALAAVKDERGRLLEQPDGAATTPTGPNDSDRLPIAPLPVGDLLNATPVTTDPKDSLTALAASAAKASEHAELAASGMDGGFQLQVASFKDPADAEKLVLDLRRRGHKAYSQGAHVPERGLWHRVRIGPFRTKFDAAKYKAEFERTERVAPFIVDPDKVKQAADIRAAKLEAREKRAAARNKQQ